MNEKTNNNESNEAQRITGYFYVATHRDCGWRNAVANAELELISEKRAKVVRCSIKNDSSSRRQQFNEGYYEQAEIGKTKNISSLWGIEKVSRSKSA